MSTVLCRPPLMLLVQRSGILASNFWCRAALPYTARRKPCGNRIHQGTAMCFSHLSLVQVPPLCHGRGCVWPKGSWLEIGCCIDSTKTSFRNSTATTWYVVLDFEG